MTRAENAGAVMLNFAVAFWQAGVPGGVASQAALSFAGALVWIGALRLVSRRRA